MSYVLFEGFPKSLDDNPSCIKCNKPSCILIWAMEFNDYKYETALILCSYYCTECEHRFFDTRDHDKRGYGDDVDHGRKYIYRAP